MQPRPARWLDRLILALGVAAVVAAIGYTAWYYLRPETPEAAYRRIHTAHVRGDHGQVYDSLTAATRKRVDVGYQLAAAEEAKKLTDLDAAHRLLQLRGRELFVEMSVRGWTLNSLQWTAIDDWHVEDDAAVLTVSRPPVRDLPTTGTVAMMREGGRWRLDEPGARR